jgi:uncharacterized protein (TIGR02594 family)
MKYMKIAESLIGQKEIRGERDNPIIMLMFQVLGHDWVEHDETPWCAALVGYCLEKVGIRSTRKLNARSYENYGQLVYKPGKKGKLSDARKGDICVFSRGNSSWQGHVAFYIRHTAKSIYVLGGNQGNAINIKPYSRSRLVCIVRPVSDFGQNSMTLRQVQQRLKDLGYHEVGKVDGIMGTKTRGAILAFREDNGLPLTPTVDAALEDALKVAPKRFVSSDRANGKPKGSRILSGANMTAGLTAAGGAGSIITAASQAGQTISTGIDTAEGATDTASRALSLFGLGDVLAPYWPYITAVIFVLALIVVWRIRAARIEDYQTGKTP